MNHISKANAVVEHAEYDGHPVLAAFLLQIDGQFVIVVAHGLVFSPKLLPCLVL